MNSDNYSKSVHGYNANNSLQDMLDYFLRQGYIERYEKNYRCGHDGYNPKQFYAPYLITFTDGSKWALYSTASLRLDRLKGQHWDSKNIKEIDVSITKCFLVFPDDIDDKESALVQAFSQRIADKIEYSAIHGVFTQSQFHQLTEAHALFAHSVGAFKDAAGRNFESQIAEVLSNKENFIKWLDSDTLKVGFHYRLFALILNKINIIVDGLISLEATANSSIIGRLPSGGKPKTDVLLSAKYQNGDVVNFSFSCKRSSAKQVTIHQYTAESFSTVLDPFNQNLYSLLREFQKVGGIKSFGKTNTLSLHNELSPYMIKLCHWATSGQGGEGLPTQIAQFIITLNEATDKVSIYSIDEYCSLLLENRESIGQFGTPFSWTYASNNKGKSIQLKAAVL